MNLTHYNENGYVVIKKAFYPAYLDQLRNKYIDIYHSLLKANESAGDEVLFSLFKENKEAFINAGLVTQNMIETYELMNAPQIMINVRQLIEKPVVVTKPYIHTSHPALGETYWDTPPHFDLASSNTSANSIVCWLPLCSLDEKKGTLRVIPGSHKEKHEVVEMVSDFGKVDCNLADFIDVDIEQGDLLLFSMNLIHRSAPNSSGNIRWAISFRFGDAADKLWTSERNLHYPYTYVKREYNNK